MTWPAIAVTAIVLLAGCGTGDRPAGEAAGDGPVIVGLPYTDYSHEDEPFARDLLSEQEVNPQVSDPELFYVGADFSGTYTNVSQLARRSDSHTDDPEAPTVWFFGGSTMFGIGQRDEHTIASEVAAIASEARTPITAVNFGWSSYVTWQEVGLFRRLLASRPPPDVVVFLHGVNDFSQVCRHLAAGIPPGTRSNPQLDTPIRDTDQVVDCVEQPDETVEAVDEAVHASMAEARAAAGDIPVLEYWQPMASTREPVAATDELLDRLGETREWQARQKDVYVAALDHPDSEAMSLTDVFDDESGPIFFDWAHTNERGAQLVAEAIWERGLSRARESLAD